MSDLDGAQEKLFDLKNDPKQTTNVARDNGDVCEAMRRRLWDDMGGDPPRYQIMREGHEWYEYPDIYDPTTDASRKLLEKKRNF